MRWPAWLYRLVPYLGRRQAEEDLHEELRLHLELERERQRDAGVPESDALRAARRTLGNTVLIRERTRDVWGWRWLDDLARDVRHAVRGLGRSRGFAATVVLVLALGIGANTAMFSLVSGLMLRPLPFADADADTVVAVGHPAGDSGGGGSTASGVSVPDAGRAAAASEWRSFVRAHRGLPQRQCRHGQSERLGGAFRRRGDAVTISAAANDPMAWADLHRGRCGGGCRPRGAVESRGLDTSLRRGPGHRRRAGGAER